MANQATVIDIDTKFLENIKKAESALISAANAANQMTDMFARATQGTGHMAQAFQSIQSGLDKVGAKADFSGGFLKVNTELRTTNDMINLFTRNLDEAKTRYSKLLADFTNPKGRIGGVRIKLLDEKELNNAKKLRNAITRINKALSTKTNKTPEQMLALVQFRDFYKSHLKELNRSDADRVNEAIKAARREFDEKLKTLRALAREVKKIEQENAKAAVDAENEKLAAARAAAAERIRLTTVKEQKQELNDVRKASNKASGTPGEADARAEISARLLNLQDQINTSTRKGYELYVRTGEQLRQNEALLTKNALKSEGAKVTLDPNGGALSLGNVESLVKITNDVKALRNAFEAIKKAKNDINPNTEEGRKQIQRLNEALAMTGRRIDECKNRQSLFMQGFNRLQGAGSGMSNMFSRIFATTAIMGFTNKVVKLHGEFEKLRKSLSVLVQSPEKANLIWGKITRLAVQSPFTVSDLATATRQMAAYRIEQDRIYEKTKMLADVSAGLGVEMSRLILAYGQVKAANFLRGTELRQFSEAGIDMLGQLATYFTQLEGRLVTAADVMERISKRQVMFEDVDEVLQRVTSRGGAFYKMQEEMATTVAGRISNLKDEFMLSMDNIGKSHNETILKAIRILKWLAQNLDVVIEKVGFMLKIWLAWKTATVVNTVATKGYAMALGLYTIATHKAAIGTSRLAAATERFNKAAKGNVILALTSIVLGLVSALSIIPSAMDSASESIADDELTSSMDHMADLAKDVADAAASEQRDIAGLSEKIKDLTKSIDELNAADDDSVDNKDRVASMMREREIALASLAGKTSEYAAELSAVINSESEMSDVMEKNNKKLAAKAVIANEIANKVNLSSATIALQEASTQKAMPRAYSGGKYDPLAAKEYIDPNGLFPDWVFEDETKIEENMQEYIDDLSRAFEKFDEAADNAIWKHKSGNIIGTKHGAKEYFNEFLYGDELFDFIRDESVKASLQDFGEAAKQVSEGRIPTGGYPRAYQNKMEVFNYLKDTIAKLKEISETKYSPQNLIESGDAKKLIEVIVGETEKTFDTSELSSSDERTKEKAQREIQAFLTEIFSAYEFPDDVKFVLKQELGKRLGFSWEDFKTPLKEWHVNYNRYLESIHQDLKDANVEVPFELKTIISGDINRDELKKTLEDGLKEQKTIIETYESYSSEPDKFKYNEITGEYEGGAYTAEEYRQAKEIERAIDEALNFLGIYGEKNENKRATSDVIKSIKDVHKAFKELQSDFDDPVAQTGAWDKFSDTLEEALKTFETDLVDFKQKFDLTTEDGMIAALEWLKEQPAAADSAFEILREIGAVTWEMKIENQRESAKKLNREIENLFSGYELSVELEELHVPKDLAQKFFDIDVTDINQLRKTLYSRKGEFVGTEQQEEYQNFLDKLDEMEAKSQQERLKKYLEFSRDAMGERGKILFESFGQLQDIAKTFKLTDTLAKNEDLITDDQFKKMRELGLTFDDLMAKGDEALMGEWGFSEDQLNGIKEYIKLLEEQQAIAEQAARKKTTEELAKFDWEKFTGSEVYQDLYNDMSNASSAALTVLINQLEKHRAEWSKLPVDQVEEYVRLLEEAKDALANTKFPSEIISDAKGTMEKSGYSDSGDASQAMINAQLEIESLDIAISQWETIAQLKKEGYQAEEISLMLNISEEKINAKSADDLKNQKTTQEDIVSKSKKYLDAVRKIQDAYDKQKEYLDKIKTCVDKVWEGWDDINSIFGDDNMSTAIAGMVKGVSDAAFGMGDMILATKSAIEGFKAAEAGAQAMGFAIDTASGILGIIVMGIKVVATVLKFAFEQHDKILQEQIDAQIEKVETLQKEYEKLAEQIENAYTAVDLGRLTDRANKNLESQIAATEKLIALEEDKKKPDEDKIDGWKEEIDDMRKSIEENWNNAFETLTDGILDDVLSVTRNFVDAWYNAFDETGDGMKGLEDNFKEMLINMLKQQASMQLISPYIDEYKDWLKKYVNPDEGDNTLTVEEAKAWADEVRSTFPEIDSLLTNLFEGASSILDNEYGELSDLEKGIQGMTEDQAEVLASYWNSCRFMLSNIDMTLTKLADNVMSNNNGSTSVLEELQTQTSVLKDIRDSLSSIIGLGGSAYHTGAYVKVSM